jgi:hypothetical protein
MLPTVACTVWRVDRLRPLWHYQKGQCVRILENLRKVAVNCCVLCPLYDLLAAVWYPEFEIHAARIEVRLDKADTCIELDHEDALGLKHEIIVICVSGHMML